MGSIGFANGRCSGFVAIDFIMYSGELARRDVCEGPSKNGRMRPPCLSCLFSCQSFLKGAFHPQSFLSMECIANVSYKLKAGDKLFSDQVRRSILPAGLDFSVSMMLRVIYASRQVLVCMKTFFSRANRYLDVEFLLIFFVLMAWVVGSLALAMYGEALHERCVMAETSLKGLLQLVLCFFVTNVRVPVEQSWSKVVAHSKFWNLGEWVLGCVSFP